MKLFVALAGVLLWSGALPAAAQQAPSPRPQRPYRALFGGNPGDLSSALNISASVGGGSEWVDAIDPATGLPIPGEVGTHRFGSFSGAMSYDLSRANASLSMDAGTGGRLPVGGVTDPLLSHSAGLQGSVLLPSKTRLTGFQRVSHQPFYGLDFFPVLFGGGGTTVPLPPTFDLSAPRDAYLTYRGGVNLSQTFFGRVAVSLGHDYEIADYAHEDFNRDVTTAGIQLTQPIFARSGFAVRLGYQYNYGRYGADTPGGGYRGSTIDAGIDYSRALSFSRRTTLSFGTGSTALTDGVRTEYRVTGNVDLNREIGRTWNLAVAYNRGVGFLQRLRQPTFADALSAQVNGLFNRRVDFQAGVGVTRGEVGLGQSDAYSGYQATMGVTTGINRHMGVSVNYAYFRYQFDNPVVLVPGVPQHLDRQTVEASLTFRLPLLQRRSNASR